MVNVLLGAHLTAAVLNWSEVEEQNAGSSPQLLISWRVPRRVCHCKATSHLAHADYAECRPKKTARSKYTRRLPRLPSTSNSGSSAWLR